MFDLVHKATSALHPDRSLAPDRRSAVRALRHRVLHALRAAAADAVATVNGTRDHAARVRPGDAPPGGAAAPAVRRATSTCGVGQARGRAARARRPDRRSGWCRSGGAQGLRHRRRRDAARRISSRAGVPGRAASSRRALRDVLRSQNPPMSPARTRRGCATTSRCSSSPARSAAPAIPSRTVARAPRRARGAEARGVGGAHRGRAVPAAGEDRRGAGEGVLRRQSGRVPAPGAGARGVRGAVGATRWRAQEPVERGRAEARPTRTRLAQHDASRSSAARATSWSRRKDEARQDRRGADARPRRASPSWRRSSRRTRARRRRAATSALRPAA